MMVLADLELCSNSLVPLSWEKMLFAVEESRRPACSLEEVSSLHVSLQRVPAEVPQWLMEVLSCLKERLEPS